MPYAPEHDEVANPLRHGLRVEIPPEPCAVVVFGASGDLAHRKLLPALYNLAVGAHLPGAFGVVGVSKSEYSDTQYQTDMREAVGKFSRTKPIDDEVWRDFAAGLRYVSGSFEDDATFERLQGTLAELDRVRATRGNRLFYFATPPSTYPTLLRKLQKHRFIEPPLEQRFTRVVIEKPFGRDLPSARALNRLVLEVLDERQVFRIDHYLGKETVQNVMVFRFGNTVFEPIWNRNYVDHVQITAGEELGVESRGRYYEEAGLLRDMIQNHVLQLVCRTPCATRRSRCCARWRPSKGRRQSRSGSFWGSTRPVRSAATTYPGISRRRTSRRDHGRRRSRPSSSTSTAGGGAVCLSTCGAGNGCPSA